MAAVAISNRQMRRRGRGLGVVTNLANTDPSQAWVSFADTDVATSWMANQQGQNQQNQNQNQMIQPLLAAIFPAGSAAAPAAVSYDGTTWTIAGSSSKYSMTWLAGAGVAGLLIGAVVARIL